MGLMELYEQHERDLKAFADLRDQKWATMMQRHGQVAEAFGGQERLPDEYVKKHAAEKQEFIKEWSNGTGTRHKALVAAYEKATAQYKDQGRKAEKQKPKQQSPSAKDKKPVSEKKEKSQLTERQQKKQEMIRQQKAMTQKQAKKRTR